MYFKTLFLISIAITASLAVKKNYAGYKVYKVIPQSEDKVRILEDVQNSALGEFWEDQFDVNHEVKIMVAPEKQARFLYVLVKANIEVTEVIEDLQRTIDEQLKPSNIRSSESFLSFSWNQYHNLDEIYNWLDELAATYPDIVSPIVMGQTVENRQIKGVVINYKPDREHTLIGMLEGTLHAREWISAASVTWIIKEFLTSTDPGIRTLAENFEWHIFPVVNPDGYVYTFTTNRMWRKNRSTVSSQECAQDIDNDMSNGVDLNRNFDFFWMSVGASNDSCTNTFAGPSAGSEPETQAIVQYVTNLNNRGELMYYIAFHSYTQLIIVPYSHLSSGGDEGRPSNYADMFEIAIRGSDSLAKRFGTAYRVGVSAEVMYPMSGTSFDWVKYEVQVPIVYLFELRDLGEFGFLLLPNQIVPTGLEFMDAFVEMDRTARVLGYYDNSATSAFYSVTVILLGALVALFYN